MDYLSIAPVTHAAAIFVVAAIALYLYRQAFSTDIPFIRGIPEAPGAVPFFGHLKVLGDDQPTKFEEWAVKHDWAVIQAKFGTRRVLVLNTFEAARHFIVKNATATIDRPIFWTFHQVLSKTQGGTIGTSPWNESMLATKKRRTVVSEYMTRPAIQRAGPMLDVECGSLVQSLYESSVQGTQDVSPEVHFKRMALNFAIMISYGTRFKDIKDPMLLNILEIVETVSTFRSTNKNFQDYVPLLRYLPANSRTALAASVREQRDEWLDSLFDTVKKAVDRGTAKDCVTEKLLNNSGKTKLTLDDMKSINVSLVSGGYETLATTATATIGFLATEEGQRVQERAFADLMKAYGSVEEAWKSVVTEEKSDYVVALVREMLRYFAPIQFLPPRQTTKEFVWNGATIPKGVTVIQNTQAINHSKSLYGDDADVFRPGRWLTGEGNKVEPPEAPYHYSYGAGSRMCPAVAISNRILYAAFARLILSLRVKPAADGKLLDTNYITYNRDTTLQTCHPKPFAIRLCPRSEDSTALFQLLASSQEEQTAD